MPNIGGRYLTVSELSEYLNIHRTTIYRLLRAGGLPGFRIGSDWRFSVDAIEQWQRDHTKAKLAGDIESPDSPASRDNRRRHESGDSPQEASQNKPSPLGTKRQAGRARRP